MLLCTPLGIWGSVGLRTCSWLSIGYVLIPTKTSRFWNQFRVVFHYDLMIIFPCKFSWFCEVFSLVSRYPICCKSLVLVVYCAMPSCAYSLLINVRSLFIHILQFSLAISPLRFGRPGDWPVSLWGQGEWAHTVAG